MSEIKVKSILIIKIEIGSFRSVTETQAKRVLIKYQQQSPNIEKNRFIVTSNRS